MSSSAAMNRFPGADEDNPWFTRFRYRPVEGLGYERGIVRRDPSCIIQVDGAYFVWYTRGAHPCQPVGHERATDSLPAMPWDLTDVWYATSADGHSWQEQGPAVERGPAGSYDERSIFTPDILAHNDRYYLVYQVTKAPTWRSTPESIAIAWADSPRMDPGPKARRPLSNLIPPAKSTNVPIPSKPPSKAHSTACASTIRRSSSATVATGSTSRAKASATATCIASGASPSPMMPWVHIRNLLTIRSQAVATKSWSGITTAASALCSPAADRKRIRFNSPSMALTLNRWRPLSSRLKPPALSACPQEQTRNRSPA